MYNPRNKTAGRVGSPVHDLLALISYLIDPVTKAHVNGRRVEVHATCREADRWPYAVAAAPEYRIADTHAAFQKQFRKSEGGSIDTPSPLHQPLLDYLDFLRGALADSPRPGRMTLAGLVARLLTFPRFRGSGYTVEPVPPGPVHRAPRGQHRADPAARSATSTTRWHRAGTPTARSNGPTSTGICSTSSAGMLHATNLDDEEVEAFADQAVAMLTFHQAKGLEFDHVYVGVTGRNVTPDTVLADDALQREGRCPTRSSTARRDGRRPVLRCAAADRDREVYVALTRAKRVSRSSTRRRTSGP